MTEFTNFENGKLLFNWAKEKYEGMQRYYDKKLWNAAVRTAQEVGELSLKSLFKTIGIDYPREHDVGKILPEVVRKKLNIEPNLLNEIQEISKWLSKERSPAFYFEKRYTEQQANKAKTDATKVFNFVSELIKKLNPKCE